MRPQYNEPVELHKQLVRPDLLATRNAVGGSMLAMPARAREATETRFRTDLTVRLRAVLAALDLPTRDFADAIGVSEQRAGNWLAGRAVPPPFYLYRICRRFGVTADYLLLDDPSGLPVRLAAGLERAAAES